MGPYTVLFLIGGSYFIAASILIQRSSFQSQLCWALGLLVGYHIAMFYLPYPGKITGEITPANNLAAYIDSNLFSVRLFMGVFDPEGPLRLLPAASMCLIGSCIGMRIKTYSQAKSRCALELFLVGLLLLLSAYIWSFFFPIIKMVWSSSFILYTAGWSAILLAAFYQIIDVWQQKWLAFFFIPIGMNSITIYAGSRYIDFSHTSDYFFKSFASWLGGHWTVFISALGYLLIQWLFLNFLYQKKIFLKV